MRGASRIITRHHRLTRVGIGLVLLLLLATLPAIGAAAQDNSITLTSSEPRSNAVLATAPNAVTLSFSGNVDTEASALRIVTRDGDTLDGTETTWADARSATVVLPDDVPRGSYLVAWNVVSEDTGDASTGFFGFTIGTDQDVAPVTIPDTGFADPAPLTWTTVAANGTTVLGLALLIAVWPLRTLTLRTGRQPGRLPLQTIAIAGATIAATGIVVRIATLAWAERSGDAITRLIAPLDDTSGQVLLVTLVLISAHSMVLATMPTATTNRWIAVAPWATTLLLTLPLPALSHAMDEPAGRIPTLTVTWLAFVALALLIGGVIALAAQKPDRTTLRAFGGITAVALPVLAMCGAYLAVLFVGNRIALDTTAYGRATYLTAIVGSVFAIGLVLALVLTQRTGASRLLLVPAVAGVVLIGCVGSLLSFDTARAELTRESSQRTVPFTLDDERAQLILAPGHAGVNHVRLELDRDSVPRQTTAEMTMRLPSLADIGTETITLSRVSGNAFEYHGTELSLADQWELEIAVTDPGRAPATTVVSVGLDQASAETDIPGTPWRFADFAGSAGVLLILTGISGMVIGIAAGRSPLRRESIGLGVGALVFAAILLGQGRLDPILALGGDGGAGAINPDDLAMITRGEDVYASSCLACHGPELRGDGPAADGMQPPPADFAEPHTRVHDEATLIYWVRNGKQGTAMPGFSDTLSDQDIRDVLSFVERRQRDLTGDASAPDPATCTVDPRSERDLDTLTALTIEERPGGELIPADNPEVSSTAVDEVSGVITEALACGNAGDLARASAHFSDSALAWAFSAGREPFDAPAPLPEDDRIELVSIGGFTALASDRVAVRVSVRDPGGTLGPLIRDLDASDQVQDVTIVLTPSGSGWLIDEVRS